MTPDTTAVPTAGAADDVMASVDDDGAMRRFVIADISRDDAWVAIPLAEAATLTEWR